MSKQFNGQLVIPVPPQTGFIYDPAKAPVEDTDILLTTKANSEHISIIDHIVGAGIKYVLDPKNGQYRIIGPVDYAPKQGWYIYHIGRKYPQPGFPFPFALKACEPPKRFLLNWVKDLTSKPMIPLLLVFALLPKKLKVRIFENFILRYLEMADQHLGAFYPRVEYFMPIALEIKGFIQIFLEQFGISLEVANRFAYAFATMIENDSAYWCRIMDLLSETTKEKLLANPVGESQRLVKVFAERDNRKHLVEKFAKFANLLKFGYFFVKKPFKTALEASEFNNFQYTEIERQFVKHWVGYEFFGKTIDERLKIYPERDTNQRFILPQDYAGGKDYKGN